MAAAVGSRQERRQRRDSRDQDVVAGYVPEVDILNGVTIEVGKGEIVTVVGPNGAGQVHSDQDDLRAAEAAAGIGPIARRGDLR